MTGTAVDVVGQAHGGLAKLQLADHRGVEIVAQPRNADTGPGILLPLTHVLAHDPGASVRGMQDGVRR